MCIVVVITRIERKMGQQGAKIGSKNSQSNSRNPCRTKVENLAGTRRMDLNQYNILVLMNPGLNNIEKNNSKITCVKLKMKSTG